MKKAFLTLVFSVLVLVGTLVATTNATVAGNAAVNCPNGQTCGGQPTGVSWCEQNCGSQKAGWCDVRAYYSPECYERVCGGNC